MKSNKNNSYFQKILIFLIFLVSLISISYSAYPQFSYTQTSYPTGQVDISGQTSSGTQISLYVNGVYVSDKDVYAPQTNVTLDGSDVTTIQAVLGSNIEFTNIHNSRVYRLNISNEKIQTINPGQTMTYQPKQVGSLTYTDEMTGDTATINVVDELTPFIFENVNDKMIDGDNTIRFVQKDLLGITTDVKDVNFTVQFTKFSNQITITSYDEVVDENKVTIKGSVQDSKYPLSYTLDTKPSEYQNTGAFITIPLQGSNFNLTISNLKEGNNSIYFVTQDTTNPSLLTGLAKINVLVDTISPFIAIKQATFQYQGSTYQAQIETGDTYINGQKLKLNISTDAIYLNYTLNNQNYSCENVENGTATCEITLIKNTQNNLTLIATDIAGNIAKEAHNIYYSDEKPEIKSGSLEPVDMFKSKVAHFFFQEIEGTTNKPGVTLTIFTLPQDAKDTDGDPISCDKYSEQFIRDLGQLDRERVYGPEYNPEEIQMSLTNFMFQKTTVTSDENGHFEAMIGLQEKNFDRSAVVNSNNPNTDSVKSTNSICFLMYDKYGNTNMHKETVTLDAGNTLWDPGEITSVPNTVYAAQIEQAGDVRNSNGNIEVGIIARFHYIGEGQISKITNFKVNIDSALTKYSSSLQIQSSRMRYKLEKDTGDMLVYFPVRILPLKKTYIDYSGYTRDNATPPGLKAVDYPQKIKLAFKALPTYTVGSKDIPIDTTNWIYFETAVNVETPYTHSRWLTPSFIEHSLKFLNKSIKYTEKSIKVMGYASVGGVVACTVAKFYHTFEIANAETPEDVEAADHKLYMICDRVGCTASPPKCDTSSTQSLLSKPGDINKFKAGTVGTLALNPAATQVTNTQGTALGKINSIGILGKCQLPTDTGTTKTGTLMEVESTKYSLNESYSFGRLYGFNKYESFGSTRTCVDPNSPQYKDGLTAASIGTGICYQEGAPYYDDTRCNFFGLSGGIADRDPANSIVSSVMCGCLTDTYSHLKNYLKIQQSIKGCLQQAQLGNIKGSYCERLIGTAVCDIATNIILPEVMKQYRSGPGLDGEKGNRANFFENMRKTDQAMNSRYAGTVLSKSGLQTNDIINKACLGAVTGDWSVLTENILTSLNQNQIEPTFGPMFTESTAQNYNPLTGTINIQYRYTLGVLSGGQRVKSQITFICDKNAPNGEYCPAGYTEYTSIGNQRLAAQYTAKGGSRQDTIVLTDPEAKFWYNKIRITHTYELKGKSTTKTYEENILHKGELAPQCHFELGPTAYAGISCDALFSDQSTLSQYIINKDTVMSPSNTFYPGSEVFVNLFYDIRGQGTQTSFNLHYLLTCRGTGGKSSYALSYSPISPTQDTTQIQDLISPYGSAIVSLFTVPDFGVTSDTGSATMTAPSAQFNEGDKMVLEFVNLDTQNRKAVNFKLGANPNIDGITGDSMTINLDPAPLPTNTNSNSNYKKQSSEFTIKSTYDSKDLVLTMLNDFKNVQVNLLKINKVTSTPLNVGAFRNPLEQTGAEVTDKLQNVQPGTCNIKFRILPSSAPRFTTEKEFTDYNPYGSNVETNVGADSAYEQTFTLSKRDTTGTGKFTFALVSPYEKQSYCYEMSGGQLTIKGGNPKIRILSQNSLHAISTVDQLSVNYSLTSDRISGNLIEGTTTTFSLTKEDESGHDIKINLKAVKNYVDTSGSTSEYFTLLTNKPASVLNLNVEILQKKQNVALPEAIKTISRKIIVSPCEEQTDSSLGTSSGTTGSGNQGTENGDGGTETTATNTQTTSDSNQNSGTTGDQL